MDKQLAKDEGGSGFYVEGGFFTSKRISILIKRLSEIAAVLYILDFIARNIYFNGTGNNLMKMLDELPTMLFNIAYCAVMWGVSLVVDYIVAKNENN